MMEAPRASSKDRRPSLHVDCLKIPEDGANKSMLATGERRLSVTSLRLRSDVEMWLMEEIPRLFGKDDSESLDKTLQEDAQGQFLNTILFATRQVADDEILKKIDDAFSKAKDTSGWGEFQKKLVDKVKECRGAFAQARKESKEVPQEVANCS